MNVRGCFDKYISAATWPPQIKIPGSAPVEELLNKLMFLMQRISAYEAWWDTKDWVGEDFP